MKNPTRTVALLDPTYHPYVVFLASVTRKYIIETLHPPFLRRFSPLVPHWLASVGDDGCLRLWDTRFGTDAVLCVNTYQTMTLKVWSNAES